MVVSSVTDRINDESTSADLTLAAFLVALATLVVGVAG